MNNLSKSDLKEQILKLRRLVEPYMKNGVAEDWQEYIAETDKLYGLIEQENTKARLDEQLSTGTLRFKTDKDGDYGEVFYFIPGEDTVKPQEDRIKELESNLRRES